MPKIIHEVDQTLEVDLSEISDDEKNDVFESHKSPDVYISDDSFPGEMKCSVEHCQAIENAEKPGFYTLKRKLFFEFTWEDEDSMSEWEENNTTTDDGLLPSYVAGDYMGIIIGDDTHDYDSDYRGECIEK